jgi:hypothetical protein
MSRFNPHITIIALLLLMSACGGGIVTENVPVPRSDREAQHRGTTGKYGTERESVFGEGGLSFLNPDKATGGGAGGGGIGVNAYLWRATLDTINFLPISSADPFGGVVITDWHSDSGSPNERFKLNVFILGRQLRADGVQVSVFRQVLYNQVWRDAAVPDGTATKIEDAFLTRARQLRNEDLAQN